MNWSYKNWLKEKLEFVKQDFATSDGSFNDIVFDVVDEQEYAKMKDYSPTTIYVVIKKYNATIAFSTTIQPIQIVVLSEQYALEYTSAILNQLTERFQYEITRVKNEDNSDTYIKHTYQKPAVMSNFIEVGAGRRSVLYIPVTLSIMEKNISFIKDFLVTVNGVTEEVKALNMALAYSMQGNTQQLPSSNLSSTVRNAAVTGMTLIVQPISGSNFIKSILDIAFGSASGNETYSFFFSNYNKRLNMKLSSVSYADSPDSVPTLQVGFTV